MLELTFSFDAPLEANGVSSEDTQAQLDEFHQTLRTSSGRCCVVSPT